MVAAFVKMSVWVLIVATLLWGSAVLYLRSQRREALEERALALPPAEREPYIREGMRAHSRQLWRWTVFLAWGSAAAFVAGLIWYVNFN